MPIKIHHGPPGSYKTAGAMGDDFLREAKAGRTIVTNVRGVSKDRLLEHFPDLPETFDVIHVDDKSAEDRLKWAKWFHWAPPGAFIFVDECQMIWPKNWRESDLRAIDYPGGLEAAQAAGRPATWEEAFEKHRHWNWDMVFTTPSYRKIRDDIRQCAEMAYKHKNLATIGLRGSYIEAAHLADDDGGSPSHFLTVNRKKVPGYVFKLYDSTATGAVSDTKVGFNIFKNPRVSLLLVVLVLCIGFVASRPLPKVLGGSAPGAAPSGAVPAQTVQTPVAPAGAVGGGALPAVAFDTDVRLEPFVEGSPYIVFSYKTGKVWKYAVRHNGSDFTNSDLLDMGYTVKVGGACALELQKEKFRRVITCALPETKGGESGAERSTPPPAEPESIKIQPGQLA